MEVDDAETTTLLPAVPWKRSTSVSAGEESTPAFVPPDMKFVPLAEAINKVRTVPTDSEFIQIASSLGIFLGREL